MKPEIYQKYRVRIKYHRTDDLQPDALPDGTELIVRAMQIADDDEKFAGEWIFEPVGRGYWLPERDLEFLTEAELVCNLYRPIFDAKSK